MLLNEAVGITLYFIIYVIGYDRLLLVFYRILSAVSVKFNKYDNARKVYITTNIAKSFVLNIISFAFIRAIINAPSEVMYPSSHISNNSRLVFKNMTALYACTDLVSLLRSTTMARSTKIHHYGVIVAFFIVAFSDFNYNSLSRAVCIYGGFSSFASVVNLYLGGRFLADKDSQLFKYIKRISLVSYIISCFGNFSWQVIYMFSAYRELTGLIFFKFFMHILLLSVWVQDDIKLIKHLGDL